MAQVDSSTSPKADNNNNKSNELEPDKEGADDTANSPKPDGAPAPGSEEHKDTNTPKSKRSSPNRRSSTRIVLKVGSRMLCPRKNGGCARATVSSLREGAVSMVIHDDLYWAGYKNDALLDALKRDEFTHLLPEDDVPSEERVALVLSPKSGLPPDCFLVGEVHVEHDGWRLFLELRPAPESGTFGQRYSMPRIAHVIASGMKVRLSGRVTPLIPPKKGDKKDLVNTLTACTFVGVVDAKLPTQHCTWALVHISESDGLHVASLFGKDAEGHVHAVDDSAKMPQAELDALLSSAKV